MKTLLVLAKQSGLSEAIRAVLDPERYRVIHYREVWAAEPLFSGTLFDACLLDADLTDIRPVRVIEQLRHAAPRCPIFVFAAARQWEWEEEAYLLGVEHVLAKPIRARLLISLLDRCWQKKELPAAVPAPTRQEAEIKSSPTAVWGSARTLEVFRDFSRILTHGLQTESLLKQFLLLLREVIYVNRAAIFLRHPAGATGGLAGQSSANRLYAACALGIPSELSEHFALSLAAGIGRHVHLHGRILKSGSDEAKGDVEIQREFDVLGVQVAIPILDRESLVGVAVFDGRLTGEFFANEELALIFHLLEALGLAIKNSWLHDELVSNHQMMADVLDQLGSGCIVIARDLTVLHANKSAIAYFSREHTLDINLEFSDLPQALASKVYEALQASTVPAPFKYTSPAAPDIIYRITIAPFKPTNAHTPNAVMLLIEDFTQYERAQTMEIEAASGRLVKSMAERLAHEIGNSLVPICTYQQMSAEEHATPEMDDSVVKASVEGIRRISRLSNQMRFLARDKCKESDVVPVTKWVEESTREALASHPELSESLHLENSVPLAELQGDYAGLRLALSEVILNALQAVSTDAPAEIMIRIFDEKENEGPHWLNVEVRDNGGGFSDEAATHATEPFFSKRTVGLGLGLTVARKIVEIHKGRLEIIRDPAQEKGLVRISLPLAVERVRPVKHGILAQN